MQWCVLRLWPYAMQFHSNKAWNFFISKYFFIWPSHLIEWDTKDLIEYIVQFVDKHNVAKACRFELNWTRNGCWCLIKQTHMFRSWKYWIRMLTGGEMSLERHFFGKFLEIYTTKAFCFNRVVRINSFIANVINTVFLRYEI